jgi:hypothetical protein
MYCYLDDSYNVDKMRAIRISKFKILLEVDEEALNVALKAANMKYGMGRTAEDLEKAKQSIAEAQKTESRDLKL